ncbi:MAG: type I methionyl aminopeptidase [Synergistaceae bacterium]|jgi:methionyl aminopeptidase|nr:type I methionyl aminopeptidase [Synergistaceae bacterium]
MVYLKTEEEIVLMRKAGKVVADILDALRETVRPGVSTAELDRVAEKYIELSGGTAAFKGYRPFHAAVPFPGTVCASVNEEIVHGIPSDGRILAEGDIVSVDVGVCLEGYYGDAACTYPVGTIDVGRKKLLRVTEEALNLALAAVKTGNTVGDVGYAVESYVLGQGFGIVRDYTGHGVGKKLHEAPQVPNFGKPGRGVTLQCGMTLAIEPMVMAGKEQVAIGSDEWVVVTADGSDAAHFERSIVVTDDGPEILTPWISRLD